MALQNCRAGASEHVVDASHSIGTCSSQFVAGTVEAGVEDFIVVAAELFDALAGAHVPQARRPVNRTGQAVIASEVELAAGELGRVALEREQALAGADVPDLCRVVERGGHQAIAVRIEMKRNNLSVVPLQAENFLTSLHVPQLRGVVHGPRRYKHAVRVERQADDLHLVAFQRVVSLACVRVPNFRLPVERTCDNLVAVRVIERHRVDDIRVLVQREKLLARIRVPHLAGAIVATRDELASVLVECAVGQGEQMGAENLEEAEALLLVLELLFDQLLDKLLELGLSCLRDQRLFQQDLVNKSINISSNNQITARSYINNLIVRTKKWRENRTKLEGIFEACKCAQNRSASGLLISSLPFLSLTRLTRGSD